MYIMKKTTTKLLTALLTLCIVLTLMPMTAFADPETYAVKFYPGDHGTMTKNDQIPFVYYGIDDDVNKPYYYKLNVSETETLSFASSIINVLSPSPGYEFAYWTADAAVYLSDNDTPISAGNALSSDQIQSKITVKSDVTFTAHFKQISEYPDESEITSATIEDVRFNYGAGEAPVASAFVTAVDYEKYDVAYECWQQFENNEPVAAWYSDNGSHGSLPTFKEFEGGKKYVYSLMLKPKDGYSFSSDTVITVNGQKVSAPFVGGSMYIPAIKTITASTVTSQCSLAMCQTAQTMRSELRGGNWTARLVQFPQISSAALMKIRSQLLKLERPIITVCMWYLKALLRVKIPLMYSDLTLS